MATMTATTGAPTTDVKKRNSPAFTITYVPSFSFCRAVSWLQKSPTARGRKCDATGAFSPRIHEPRAVGKLVDRVPAHAVDLRIRLVVVRCQFAAPRNVDRDRPGVDVRLQQGRRRFSLEKIVAPDLDSQVRLLPSDHREGAGPRV